MRFTMIQDPIATQFPLALAIEPRLLPLAVANGFTMDSKVSTPVHSPGFTLTYCNSTETSSFARCSKSPLSPAITMLKRSSGMFGS
jgi:hypothetical protein